ncbi:tropinone reductase homolog At5g06060-like [Solanum stenotomum]|uniref:tropinone reductase homolog At5g06060-like n=1 Tax=Solanum stenotomum TaxID=172797 RepID=UPI0020D16DE5|nr:tropinone reductase homolog At5g06060-like [Solanum stenotomum]
MAKVAAFAKSSIWSLNGLAALVTGGTTGIGHAVVEELGGLGAKVYTCSKTESELNEPMQDWADRGIQVKGSACDVTCRDQRIELMKKVSSEFDGKLNILINNVGTNIWKHSIDYNAEDYAHMMATNLESSFHFSQLAHPLLKSSGDGSIVFTASVAGLVHVSGTSIYGATKAGMIQLTRNLACEWGRDGIRVNAVAPCYTNTPLVKHLLKDKEFSDALISRIPLGRSGEVEEVSSLIAYLCLPGASYVTGQIIPVDGGFTVYGFQQPGY